MKQEIFEKIKQFSHFQNCAVPYNSIINKFQFQLSKSDFDKYIEELKEEKKITISKLNNCVVFYLK